MRWTKGQEEVIKTRNCNLLVSAAAGSGKTAVLVERIISKISEGESPLNIDELLVVTFTKAAAAEMKERIGAAIDKKRMEQPDNSHLQKQASLIHTAKIMTIDSFCLDVIRNYFHFIDLDPGFRIGNEAELTLLKSDVLGEVIERYYEEAREDFFEFIECYAGTKTDKRLEEYILKLYDFSMSYPWPLEWLDMAAGNFEYTDEKDFFESRLMEDLLSYIKSMLSDAIRLNKTARKACMDAGGPYMYEDALLSDSETLDMLINISSYEDMYSALSDISFMTLSRKKDSYVLNEKREYVKELRGEVKDIVSDIKKSYFYQPKEEMYQDVLKVKPSMKILCDITKDFITAFADKKKEKNLIDFSDMEHFALKILIERKAEKDLLDDNQSNLREVPTKAAEDLQAQYAEIMIDEYQDSNFVQEKILNSISREHRQTPNIFMVGDVKQSIYKFRLAKPELFMDKYERYTVSEGLHRRIDLHMNFRSRENVLDSVNHVFSHIMRKDFGGIVYDDFAKLYTGAQYPLISDNAEEFRTELLLVTKDEGEEEEYNSTESNDVEKEVPDIYQAIPYDKENYSRRELEAHVVARRIKELIHPETGIHINKIENGKETVKIAELRDIVILLRTMSGWSELFLEVLAEEGIQAYAETKTGYFQTLEIKTMLSFLMILDNPRQDIPFTAILYSPFAGLTSEELSQIRIFEKKKCMYESAKSYAEDGTEDEIKVKLNCFLKLYSELRIKSGYMTVKELIQEILTRTGYDYYVLAMPLGEQRKRNLDMLIKQAAAFEETSYHGLFQFVRYVDRLIKYDVDYGENGGFSEQDNAVRIMSVHKSKGLEFPVVILSGLSKKFNQSDTRASLVLHPEHGIGPDCIDYRLRTKVPTLLKKMIQHKSTAENLSEETRVLYVAMTRAKEKLIMTGYVEDTDKILKKWETAEIQDGQFLLRHLLKAGSFLDYVGPCAMHESDINIKVLKTSEIIDIKAAEQWERDKLIDDFEYKLKMYQKKPEITDELLEEINYIYPYAKESELPIKTSVSALKKQSVSTEECEEVYKSIIEPYVPGFLENREELRASDLGTLYHKVMEFIDFSRYYDIRTENASIYDFVIKHIDSMLIKELISKEEMEQLRVDKFVAFLETDLAYRMSCAAKNGKLFKEQRFVLKRPACELVPDYEGEADILIQGIFDAYFEEEDDVILVDYKTDYVPYGKDLMLNNGNINDRDLDSDLSSKSREDYLIKKYEVQLSSYHKALQQLTGKKVKDTFIYSFYMSEMIKVQ